MRTTLSARRRNGIEVCLSIAAGIPGVRIVDAAHDELIAVGVENEPVLDVEAGAVTTGRTARAGCSSTRRLAARPRRATTARAHRCAARRRAANANTPASGALTARRRSAAYALSTAARSPGAQANVPAGPSAARRAHRANGAALPAVRRIFGKLRTPVAAVGPPLRALARAPRHTWLAWQAASQEPQCRTLSPALTQLVPHAARPGPQAAAHPPADRANLPSCTNDAAGSTVRGVLHHVGAAATARAESGDARHAPGRGFARFAKAPQAPQCRRLFGFIDAFVGAREPSVCAAAITRRARASEQEHG